MERTEELEKLMDERDEALSLIDEAEHVTPSLIQRYEEAEARLRAFTAKQGQE